ncbi:hypothetical protein [Nonomuraea bangladeshensis]|uniref:hypothetical protein n=1 Tax=Nonomuraea bangladeshensis TaxID=404385 RepID=UPI003C2B961F
MSSLTWLLRGWGWPGTTWLPPDRSGTVAAYSEVFAPSGVGRKAGHTSRRGPADPHEPASAQPGDTVGPVPGSSAETTIAVMPVGDQDG